MFSLLYFTGVAQIPSFMPSGGRLVDIEETFGCSTIRKDYKYNVKLKSNQMLVYKLCYDKSMNIPTHSSHTLQTPVHEQIFRISYSNQKFSKNLISCSHTERNIQMQMGETFQRILSASLFYSLYFIYSVSPTEEEFTKVI